MRLAVAEGKERSCVELLTNRLRLRQFKPTDFQAYCDMNGDPEVMRWLGGPRSTAQSISEIEFNNCTLANSQFGKVAVERLSDGAFVGMCGLSYEEWYPDELEIGWRLLRQYWGYGYATEAASAWLQHAFSTLAASRVISISDAPNLRSIAVMKRLNMKLDHTAELFDDTESFECVIYSIRRSEGLRQRNSV
jgi:RimJ/RimL family protein N-acetyltransferase